MSPYKVLVVDDSAFMRKLIGDMISEDGRFEVIHSARNGKEAVDKVRELKPDVVTLDVEMPVMNGLEALELIMKENPLPVVMLSSLTMEGAKETIKALDLGAIDFVQKPSGAISLDLHKVKKILIEKLLIAAQSTVRSSSFFSRPLPKPAVKPLKESLDKPRTSSAPAAPAASPSLSAGKPSKSSAASGSRTSFKQIVAIGTSTGGPRALQHVLADIPADIQAPILIVQHMPPKFTKSLAERLDSLSHIHVVEAEDGMVVEAGTAYIAPGGHHMRMVKEGGLCKIKLSGEEPRGGHRPSVDTMYESLLPFKEYKRHIVIMTGMGSDGAKGMKALKEAGASSTIAESQDTCVVYGMPRSAVELNAADYVIPLHGITEKIVKLVQTSM